MSAMNPKIQKTYSFKDYLNWSESERVELIDGTPYMMTPAPSRLHQQVLLELGRQFANFLKGKTCEVNIAPFDVRLPEENNAKDKETMTVVQPDLVVVCDPAKLDDRGCKGAPDLIIEILSPSNAAHDYIIKMNLYEKKGVKEYWIVHPVDKVVMVHYLNNGKYDRPEIFDRDGCISVKTVQGLDIELHTLFEE
ncbi:Uma2 family endonuclease [Evansella sp. AB-rgal1]|uniref:Uma2 family endonuclease n=1 Tax=Evansella sp. AB-rgal1 TaxID=3242696 RepID=UPI00359CDBCB